MEIEQYHDKSIGLSRAVLKRKKKLLKNNDKEKKSTNNSTNNSNSNKKLKIVHSSVLNNLLDNLKSLSLVDIINKTEVTELTSDDRSYLLLSIILHPITLQQFYDNYINVTPLHCLKENNNYLKRLINKKTIEKIINTYSMKEHLNINIISNKQSIVDYDNSSVDISKDIKSNDIWNRLTQFDCLELVNIQLYNDTVWKLLVILEHEFSSSVSCYLYLSLYNNELYYSIPNNGDLFLIQIEGQSNYSIYKSDNQLSDDIIHPIFHSTEPFMSVKLNPGDSLYLPSNWFYKQITCEGNHSLVLRIQFNQSNQMKDFIQMIIPQAIESACITNKSLTSCLPKGYLNYMGVAYSEDDENEKRVFFHKSFKSIIQSIVNESDDLIDAASDQMGKQFIIDRLPVPLTEQEEVITSAGYADAIIYPYTKLRMLRPGIARAIVEDGMVIVYHCMDNSKIKHESPINPLEFELDDGLAIEGLLKAYPDSVMVADLNHPSEEMDDKVSIAQALFKEGFLVIDDITSQVNNEDDNDDDPF